MLVNVSPNVWIRQDAKAKFLSIQARLADASQTRTEPTPTAN